jgi:tetratricopeptide (TPR) repeat protein
VEEQFMRSLVLCLAILFTVNAQAADPAPAAPAATATEAPTTLAVDPVKSNAYTERARKAIDNKDWPTALDEIRLATQYNPQSQEAWLILGTVAMRLEHNKEALDAFNKYLALKPSAEKAAAVHQRVVELEIRVDKENKQEQEKAAAAAKSQAERFGPKGAGFIVGFSPSYSPTVSKDGDLHASISKSFDFGFKVNMFDFGLRLGSGTVSDAMTVKDTKNAVLRTEAGGGKYSLTELYMRGMIPIKEPEEGKPGPEFAVPLHFGGFLNSVKFTKSYWNMGFNLGTGGMFRYYTNSNFAFDLMALYNLSLPFFAMENNETEVETLYNPKGNKVYGNLAGLEMRAGITILF